MGVEYGGFCHDCKHYIDAHKAYCAGNMIAAAAKNEGRYSDFSYWGESLGYWGSRLVYFMLRHAKHDAEVITDTEDKYWDLCGTYKEVSTPDEMEAQRKRLDKENE